MVARSPNISIFAVGSAARRPWVSCSSSSRCSPSHARLSLATSSAGPLSGVRSRSGHEAQQHVVAPVLEGADERRDGRLGRRLAVEVDGRAVDAPAAVLVDEQQRLAVRRGHGGRDERRPGGAATALGDLAYLLRIFPNDALERLERNALFGLIAEQARRPRPPVPPRARGRRRRGLPRVSGPRAPRRSRARTARTSAQRAASVAEALRRTRSRARISTRAASSATWSGISPKRPGRLLGAY